MERVRGWIRSRPLIWASGLVFLGFVVGAAIAYSDDQDLEEQISELQADLEESMALSEQLESDVEAATERAERHRREARNAERNARRDLRGREEDLDRRERQLNNREDELEQREAGVVEREAMRDIEDGVWEVGVDIDPGTYRTASQRCYNARLTHPNARPGDGMLSNNNGPDTVTLSEGEWFESSNCDWERIGD